MPRPTHRAAVVVVAHRDRVLLLRRGAAWASPGGFRKRGETARDTAVRELAEETGVRTSPSSLVDIGTLDDERGPTAAFLLRVDRRFDPQLSREHSGSQWVPLSRSGETVVRVDDPLVVCRPALDLLVRR